MNWDAIGAAAEMIGALGVILSLTYVAKQLRVGNLETQRANARQTASDLSRVYQSIFSDERVSEIILRGCEDLHSLDPVERYRMDLALAAYLQTSEQAFADYREGRYTEDGLIAQRNAISGVLGSPGGSVWWEERKVWFSRAFRKDVEALLASPPEDSARAGAHAPSQSTD